jgi:conjugative relaxase-like TrwC/TraI family protein
MLSIGKLAAGQAKYYLDQAEGRVDVVDSVGEGAEEYYTGGSEARGEWLGSASIELGLDGPVEPEQLRGILAGLDPTGGAELRDAAHPVRVAAFDLTFSAPKSVSVIFGVGDVVVRQRVRTAHDRAAREAVAYIERSAAAVRRGSGGAIVEEASGLVAAAFRHRTSRAGDPQLHTHVLVANLGRGIDGRWSALDGRRLYAHARTASFVYQAVLRAELTRGLGVEWEPIRKGIAELAGVPQPVRRAFSRRRAEIEAALDAHDASSPRAAEAAALATRRAKDSAITPDDLVAEWQARAAALGLGREELFRVIGRSRAEPLTADDWERVLDGLAGSRGLTLRTSTFSRREVIEALCEALPAGANVDGAALEAAADSFLNSARAVPLVPPQGEAGESFRRRDGRLMPTSGERLRYSTPEHLALEQRLVKRVAASSDAGVGVARTQDVDRILDAHPTLSLEQRELIQRLCLDGAGVDVVAGRPGTGKTFALAAAREAWQAAGHPVLGVAIARRAAQELQAGAGIQSTSVAALLRQLELGVEPLPAGTVLVVDEAGMVPTRDLVRLLDHAERARGKLVLVGDHRQLPELEAGGAFHGLVRRGLATELTENVRQVHAWERKALDDLRAGRAGPALEAYLEHGRVRVESTDDAARERLVRDWVAAGQPDRAVMIAHRRVDVADLNARAREWMIAAGALRSPALPLPGGEFAAGDRVLIKSNDRRLAVSNGDRGRVLAVDPSGRTLTAQFGDRRVVLDGHFLERTTQEGEATLLHGYAITGHVAQGLTVDETFVLAGQGISQEWAYVALSRGRESNRLYVAESTTTERQEFAPTSRDTRDPIERLQTRLEASSAQVLAIDSGGVDPLWRAAEGVRRAAAAREALEAKRVRLPGQLERARETEAAARRRLADVERAGAERRHGRLPFVDRDDALHERAELARRLAERRLTRDRDLGREL